MRARKLLKIFAIGVASLLLLVALAFMAFIWNPFEGSVADLRDAVPRNVDFYLRKPDLADDFTDFPDPVFYDTLKISSIWGRFEKSGLYARTWPAWDRTRADLRAKARELRQGWIDLLDDVIGRDLIVYGRLTGRLEDADWCVLTRVSRKVRIGMGALANAWLRPLFAQVPIQPQPEGVFALAAPGAEPVFVAIVKDLLLIARKRETLLQSLKMARGEVKEDSIGSISEYIDDVEKPLQRWARVTGERPDAAELVIRPQSLLRATTWDDNWPDANSPEDPFQRILALFLDLKAHKTWTGAVTQQDDGLALLLRATLNRNALTAFQQSTLDVQPQPTKDFVREFMASCVPEKTGCGLILRVPIEGLIEELFLTIPKQFREEINSHIQGAQVGAGKPVSHAQDLIRRVAPAFLPQVALLVRDKNFDANYGELTGCTIHPSPVPAIAACLWVKPSEVEKVNEFIKWFGSDSVQKRLLFGPAFTLDSGPGGIWKVREWCHSQIEGTGELAAVLMTGDVANYLIISNSGPYVKEIVELTFARLRARQSEEVPSIMSQSFFQGAMDTARAEMPAACSGFVFAHGDALRVLLSRYEEFAALRLTPGEPDPDWALEQRPGIEGDLLRRTFPHAANRNMLTSDEVKRLDAAVDEEMGKRWVRELPRFREQAIKDREDVALLVAPLGDFYGHFLIDGQSLSLQARLRVEYR